MTMVPAMILAGGQSRRMGGREKGLLPLGAGSVLAAVLARITPQASHVALNANGNAARFKDYELPVRADSIAGHPGPLAGVLAAMDWAHELGEAQVVTLAADTPFFPIDLVARLVGASASAQGMSLAATPHADGPPRLHPTFGLWPVHLRDDLREALDHGTRKMVLWTQRHNPAIAVFDNEADPFFNINTPEDHTLANLRYQQEMA